MRWRVRRTTTSTDALPARRLTRVDRVAESTALQVVTTNPTPLPKSAPLPAASNGPGTKSMPSRPPATT